MARPKGERTERLHQRHKPETIRRLREGAEKTHRTQTLYVEHSITEQARRDGVK